MKSQIVSLSKNEDFKKILSGNRISNKYVTIFFKKLSVQDNKFLNISFVTKKKIGNAIIKKKIKKYNASSFKNYKIKWRIFLFIYSKKKCISR